MCKYVCPIKGFISILSNPTSLRLDEGLHLGGAFSVSIESGFPDFLEFVKLLESSGKVLPVRLRNNPGWSEGGGSLHRELISHSVKISYGEFLMPGSRARTFTGNQELWGTVRVYAAFLTKRVESHFVNGSRVLWNGLDPLSNPMLDSS